MISQRKRDAVRAAVADLIERQRQREARRKEKALRYRLSHLPVGAKRR